MLNAHITIEKDLAVKAWRRAMRFRAFNQLSYFYATRLTIVWLVLATADIFAGAGELMSFHLGVLALVWAVATTIGYIRWYGEVESKTEGWEFDASLNEMGVSTSSESSVIFRWDHYKSYKEFEDYLEIEDQAGNFTFLPKSYELSEVVEFTKQNISSK